MQQNKLSRLLAVTNDQVEHGAPVGKTTLSTTPAPNVTASVVQINGIPTNISHNGTMTGTGPGKTVTGSTVNSNANLLKSPLDASFAHMVDSTPLLTQLQQQAATNHGTEYRIHREFINMRPLSANASARSASGAAAAAVKQQKSTNTAAANQKTVQRMKNSQSAQNVETIPLQATPKGPTTATTSTNQLLQQHNNNSSLNEDRQDRQADDSYLETGEPAR